MKYEMSKEDVYNNQLFMTCNKSIMKVFDSYDSSANKKRFPKEYVKYWELQFLFMATASKHSNQSLGFTYDDYGNYKDYIRKEMITFLKKSGLGIDYDKVKSGFYDKPAYPSFYTCDFEEILEEEIVFFFAFSKSVNVNNWSF